MPVYNDERNVGAALGTLLGQTYRDFRLVVSDNASTDGTPDLLRDAAARDDRVEYHRQPSNVGLTGNLEAVLARGDTELFMWAASDDLWHPRFAELLVAALDAEPGAAMAFGPYTFIDEHDAPIGGVRVFDYGAPSAAERLEQLVRVFDDGCFYGIYRRPMLDGARFPRWWGRNKRSPVNNAYPLLFHVLARGDFAYAGNDEPLWLNRLSAGREHFTPHRDDAIKAALFGLLRRANVAVECLAAARRASGSTALAARVAPVFAAKIVRDAVRRASPAGSGPDDRPQHAGADRP